MNPIRNEKGIALVMALMLTLISLTIAMTLLYMIIQGIKTSASNKRYQNIREASYGGVELLTKDVIPTVFSGFSSSVSIKNKFTSLDNIDASGCLGQKITLQTSQWNSSCVSSDYNAKSGYDIAFNLYATTGQPYRIFAKIVDTQGRKFFIPDGSYIQSAGNTDSSGLMLEGAGTTESNRYISPPHFPYVYRIEVLGERTINPGEQSKLSALYAY